MGSINSNPEQPESVVVREAICVIPELQGWVHFARLGSATLRIEGDLRNLKPGEHGMHVHRLGDLTDGCASTCVHFNPLKQNHGDRCGPDRHLGDLGNIEADGFGRARFAFRQYGLALQGWRSIVGRALVIHELRDDLGKGGVVDGVVVDPTTREESLKTGNSGKRVGCGVIGIRREG